MRHLALHREVTFRGGQWNLILRARYSDQGGPPRQRILTRWGIQEGELNGELSLWSAEELADVRRKASA